MTCHYNPINSQGFLLILTEKCRFRYGLNLKIFDPISNWSDCCYRNHTGQKNPRVETRGLKDQGWLRSHLSGATESRTCIGITPFYSLTSSSSPPQLGHLCRGFLTLNSLPQ
jgi:hypothetical protein